MEPDLFDTEEYDTTPVTSDISRPEFVDGNTNRTSTKKFMFPIKQSAILYSVNDENLEILDLDECKIPIANPEKMRLKDYFSSKHLRERISALLLQISQFDEADVKIAKSQGNPYSLVKNGGKFRNAGAVYMSNLANLYTDLIQQNYLIPTFYFVTLGECGGYSEFVRDSFQKSFFGDMKGFALFPKMNFVVEDTDSKSFKSDQVNSENIMKFTAQIMDEMQEPSAMLIISRIGVKVKDVDLQEKYTRQYIVYNILVTLKLMARGGNLIINTTSMNHLCTIELILFLTSLFEKISIIKPFSVMPHNTKRTFLGLGYKGDRDIQTIENLSRKLENLTAQGNDLESLADFDKLMKHENFQKYIKQQNDIIARDQILALERVISFLQDPVIVM